VAKTGCWFSLIPGGVAKEASPRQRGTAARVTGGNASGHWLLFTLSVAKSPPAASRAAAGPSEPAAGGVSPRLLAYGCAPPSVARTPGRAPPAARAPARCRGAPAQRQDPLYCCDDRVKECGAQLSIEALPQQRQVASIGDHRCGEQPAQRSPVRLITGRSVTPSAARVTAYLRLSFTIDCILSAV